MIQQIELEHPPILIHEFIHAEEKIDALIISLEKYAKCFAEDLDRGLLEEETIAVFHEFQGKANELINGLYFKPLTHQLSEDFYGKYFYLLHSLEAAQQKWGKHQRRKEVELASEAKFGPNLDLDLRGFSNEFKIIIRYWLCNSSRILNNKEIDSIMKNVAKIYDRVIEEPSNVNTWKLLNDLLGFNKNRLKTTIFERQIYGNPARSLSRFNPLLRIDDFAPLTFHASLYANIRAKFPVLLREAFSAATSTKENEEIWENLEKLLFPPMAVNGSCLFNGKSVEKSKEDMAFGIYLEQYNHLTTLLTDAKGPKHNINVTIELEKRKILSKLFETMKLKSIKVADRPRNNQMENRFRARQAQTPEEIIQHLAEMGIERSYAEIALQNIEYPDQNLAVQWIDNNRNLVEEQVMLRAIEKSVNLRNNSNPRQQQAVKDGIVEANLDRFRKEVSGPNLRNWIKFLYKELFQSANMEEIYSVKDILFLCMDYLAQDAKVKQYVNFNEKIIKDIDELNKEDNIAVKLKRLISLMETMVDKLPKSRALFYEKSINMKAISFLSRLNEEDQGKIFSLLNAYLPIVTPEILTPELEEYLHYLLDLTHQYRMNSKAIIQIFYKIAKSKRQSLIERITRNIVEYLSLNLIKESIVPILSIVFESDRQLSQTNAELDLKTYIFERYKHRINAFHPEKQHVLEMDIKQFSTNFSKYDKDSSIYEVSKKLLAKKKNKNKYFYYDCRKQENAFDYSVFAQQKFIGFALKDHHKTIVRCMIALLLRSPKENQEELMIQILKILSFYRILLPFALNENVDGTNLLQWLLDSPSQSKYKYKLLAFLTLNNNIFIRKTDNLYGFYSIADYTCAKIIDYVTAQKEIKYETVLSCYYLQQIRRFSEFCTTPLSEENKTTLLSYMEEAFKNANPVQHLAITELLNVQYKRILLNNLRRKYKIIGVESQPYFERQFLNLSAFYNSLSIREPEPKTKPAAIPNRNPILLPAQQPQLGEELGSDSEEDNSGNNMDVNEGRPNLLLEDGSYFQSLSLGRRQNSNFYEQLLAPLPQKQEKQGEVEQVLEPIVINNSFTVHDIITLFNQYFAFDIEIQDKVVIHQAYLPVRPIKINENLSFKVNLNDGVIDIELRVRKNTGFERHFNEIMHFLSGKTVLQEKRPATAFEKRVQEISRRIFSGDTHVTLEHRQEMLQQLERLMVSREHREEEAQQQQPVRVLNATDIYANVPEFAEPIVPVLPKPAKVEVEQRIEEQVPIEPVVNNPPQNQEVPMDIEQPIEQNAAQELQQQQQQPAQEAPVVVPVVIQVEQIQPIEPVIPVEPAIPIVAEPVPVVEQIPLVDGPNIVQEQLIQQAEIPLQPAVNPPANQPPIRDREILRVFGLPQTFLRDAGIDEESFDCLPQDFQQEQLMHLISQQNRASSQPQNANNPNPNNNVPVVDQVNQNVAFLASLDAHTRAQVLIQATPDFLSTLPVNFRQEAENLRHQQINRIIQEEQIQEQRKMAIQKPKINVVYPKVKKQQFSKISEDAAKLLFSGIFYIYPNFKLPAIKILLENKQNQAKTVTSIVALLRYLQNKQKSQLFPLKEVKMVQGEFITTHFQEWTEQQVKNIRISLLHTIYEHLKIPFYKDQQFLIGKLPAQAYLPQLQRFFEGQKQIQTQIQFFEYSLKYYPALSSELIRTITDLPDRLLIQIVEGIKVDSFPKEFYENLQNFSDNQKLKELFNTYFEHQRPKIEIFGRLLRYNFSHVPYLRKVHEQALEFFNNTYYDFLNQIFRIYTLETLEEVEPMLVKHKAIHFEVIKYLYQANRELEKEPIAILLKKPHLLDFETKKFIFRNHPRIRKLSRHRVHIQVDRSHLFQGSYNQLMSRSLRELQGRIQVSFVNEPGYDAGGLKREWFLVVSREIFNQDYALFQKSSSGSTYQPNPKSYINPDHLNYFKFIGRFIGKALVERQLIDAYFTRAFYKMILGQELQFKDLEAQDYEFYKSMEWLKNNPIDEDMFTFSYIYDNFGNKIEKELVPGGKSIIVNEENKKEYIEKYCLSKMRDDFSTQVNKFLEGFYEIVPQECISFFEAKELELLISGVPEVDVEDLKENTDYSGYAPGDQIILWFWEIVEGYSQEDLAKLVQFITGTSKIPVEGFSQLVGMNGIQRISIHRDPCDHQLPKSHTCFNQLDLPNYASKQILQQKLAICLAWGSEGFGFM